MNIPDHIVNKIMFYNSHPVADIFKYTCKESLDEYTNLRKAMLKIGEYEESCSFYDVWVNYKTPEQILKLNSPTNQT